MTAWLDALLGRIANSGVQIPLSKGINFADGLTAVFNQTTKMVDVVLSQAGIALSRIGPVSDYSIVAKPGAGGPAAPSSLAIAANSLPLRSAGNVVAQAIAEGEIVGRPAGGNLGPVTPAQLRSIVGAATQSAVGIAEYADAAEAAALTALDRALSPGTLPIASDTQRGVAERATALEVAALADAERFVVPATIPLTSTSQQGIVRQATSSEVIAATDNALAVSPGRLHRHPGVAKMWSEASGTASTSFADYNLTSVTDAASGVTTFTIGTDFSSTAYAPLATAIGATGADLFAMVRSGQAAGSFVVEVVDAAGTSTDPAALTVVAFGDQV